MAQMILYIVTYCVSSSTLVKVAIFLGAGEIRELAKLGNMRNKKREIREHFCEITENAFRLFHRQTCEISENS